MRAITPHSPQFKAEVLRDLLYDVVVTPEFTDKYQNVTPSQVRRWIREACQNVGRTPCAGVTGGVPGGCNGLCGGSSTEQRV